MQKDDIAQSMEAYEFLTQKYTYPGLKMLEALIATKFSDLSYSYVLSSVNGDMTLIPSEQPAFGYGKLFDAISPIFHIVDADMDSGSWEISITPNNGSIVFNY